MKSTISMTLTASRRIAILYAASISTVSPMCGSFPPRRTSQKGFVVVHHRGRRPLSHRQCRSAVECTVEFGIDPPEHLRVKSGDNAEAVEKSIEARQSGTSPSAAIRLLRCGRAATGISKYRTINIVFAVERGARLISTHQHFRQYAHARLRDPPDRYRRRRCL